MASAANLATPSGKASYLDGSARGDTSIAGDAAGVVIGTITPLAEARVSEKRVLDVIKARRAREKHFNGDLFADPAWDLLLELYAAELGQRRICVSTLCAAAAVPQTTALRWIKALEAKGLIHRQEDRFDQRRHYMSLSNGASAAMTSYFNMPCVQAAFAG